MQLQGRATMDASLALKSYLIGTPLEPVLHKIRWIAAAAWRRKHPDAIELALEDIRFPLVLRKLLPPDANCIDVGAHIGSFTSMLCRLFPSGEHIAIEAVEAKAALVRAKFRNVRVETIAVGSECGMATFEQNNARPGFSRVMLNNTTSSENSYYTLAVKPLDALVPADYKANLIKIDIEGGELNALRGARVLINRCQPAILFECASEDRLAHLGADRRSLYDFITGDLNYAVHTFTDILYDKGPLSFDEFRKCGLWPFRAFNFVALPQQFPLPVQSR